MQSIAQSRIVVSKPFKTVLNAIIDPLACAYVESDTECRAYGNVKTWDAYTILVHEDGRCTPNTANRIIQNIDAAQRIHIERSFSVPASAEALNLLPGEEVDGLQIEFEIHASASRSEIAQRVVDSLKQTLYISAHTIEYPELNNVKILLKGQTGNDGAMHKCENILRMAVTKDLIKDKSAKIRHILYENRTDGISVYNRHCEKKSFKRCAIVPNDVQKKIEVQHNTLRICGDVRIAYWPTQIANLSGIILKVQDTVNGVVQIQTNEKIVEIPNPCTRYKPSDSTLLKLYGACCRIGYTANFFKDYESR